MTLEKLYAEFRMAHDDPFSVPAWHELDASARRAWDVSVGKVVRQLDKVRLTVVQGADGDDAAKARIAELEAKVAELEAPRATKKAKKRG